MAHPALTYGMRHTLSDDFVNEAVDCHAIAPLTKPSVTEYQPRTLPVMQTSVLIVVPQHMSVMK